MTRLKKLGVPERFDDIFADWVVANYLNAPDADPSGRYGYKTINLFPMAISEEYSRYPASGKAQVSQYGVDYIRLKGSEPLTIRFEGQSEAPLVDATPQGKYSWWSNRGDQSNSTLTRSLDLRNATSPTLQFSAWYEIEDGWDYAYVEASTDGGKTWQILPGKYTTRQESRWQRLRPGLDRRQRWRRPGEVGRRIGGSEPLRRQGDPPALRNDHRRCRQQAGPAD